ncbi:MAG: tetratricopeptide repeat protein [Alistipes sp.]|nr:tetratricopeptide repeat protein [Alistipes sp.]
MTKKVNTPETDVVVNAKGKLEVLFEKYGKALLWALVVVAIGVGGYLVYKSFKDSEEQERISKSEVAARDVLLGEADAMALADNSEFEGTDAVNFANYLAAARCLQDGDLDAAEKYINKFANFNNGGLGAMVNAMAYGIRGDIAVERGNNELAITEFNNALAASDDMHTFVYFNEKLGRLYINMGNNEAAVKCFEAIVEKYPELEDAGTYYGLPLNYDKYIW